MATKSQSNVTKGEQFYKRMACFALSFMSCYLSEKWMTLTFFIHGLVLVVDVAAAADHSHQSRQLVVHKEEDNSLQHLHLCA